MPKRKRKPGPAADWEAEQQARLDELALYNAECARGIVHTPEWDERMAKRQAKFDADTEQQAQWQAEQYTWSRRKQAGLHDPVHGQWMDDSSRRTDGE